MKLFLVRHGESKANAKKICQGQLDYTLSVEGKEQAKKIALKLKLQKFDYIYSSDLSRAYETTLEINKYHNLKIIKDIRLREKNHGDFQGKNRNSFNYNQINQNLFVRKAENGESLLEHKIRTLEFLNEILSKGLHKNILIVSHGGVIRIIIQELLGLNPKEIYYDKNMKFPNTSYYILYIKQNGAVSLVDDKINKKDE